MDRVVKVDSPYKIKLTFCEENCEVESAEVFHHDDCPLAPFAGDPSVNEVISRLQERVEELEKIARQANFLVRWAPFNIQIGQYFQKYK